VRGQEVLIEYIVAAVAGGSPVVPGEISLAHNGVLFLDEIAEFNKKALDALRQPMEDKVVTVSRVMSTGTFPANFMLVSAMNPCPCGDDLGSNGKNEQLRSFERMTLIVSLPLTVQFAIAVISPRQERFCWNCYILDT